MNIDKAIVKTRNDIINVLNNSGIPLSILDLLLGEIKTALHAQVEENVSRMSEDTEANKNESTSGE